MVKLTDKAILMCQLAEHQDKLDESVDKATLDYMNAQSFASSKLRALREAIDLRDAMIAVRKHVGRTE